MALRSYLFVPGNRPDRFAKACDTVADVVIIDLEDAVPAEEKPSARETVASWLSAAHPVYIRINAAYTEWFQDDLAILQLPGVAGVVLPKAEKQSQVAMLASRIPGDMRIVLIAETALGVWNALELASSPKVERLGFGSIDFRLDTNIIGEYEELLYARSRVVLASRVAGILSPLDGVTTAIEDADLLAADVQMARLLGFGGKFCIHPKQVAAVNKGFRPLESEIAWAKSVIEAVGLMGEGAIRVDGKMIDRPMIEQAKKILEIVND
jgi:citrate lyase subunit beta/citryl-CoA lyase